MVGISGFDFDLDHCCHGHDFNLSVTSYVLYKTYIFFNEINDLNGRFFDMKLNFSYRENISRCSKIFFAMRNDFLTVKRSMVLELRVIKDASGIIDRLVAKEPSTARFRIDPS
jgi:hypothetical protein